MRAFNCVLSQGESIGYFVGAVVVNIAVRGPAYGTQEVLLPCQSRLLHPLITSSPPQVALLSFVHACARAVWAFGYIIGVMQLRTGAWICTLIANAGLYVLVLEKLGTQKILGA